MSQKLDRSISPKWGKVVPDIDFRFGG